ncbi:MAG: substrate-binding domain-containing protein [Bacteroidia bacterium]|nr:substrate-binding domain-containing protein [Bacteroidia bacterium]
MNPLARHIAAFCLAIVFLVGCANQNRLVVYADPWLAEFADSLVAQFQAAHPETDIQLKVLSSEVIVQHIRFGQPVDVFLCFGCEWYQQADFRKQIAVESTMASSQVVLISRKDSLPTAQQRTMQTENAVMVEASDRPMRLYTDQTTWANAIPKDRLLYANFQRQATDYLLRGWVAKGFLPVHFARQHAAGFQIEQQGPLITNAFTSILMQNAPHKPLAEDFFALANSEKSKAILAHLRFLP